MQKIAKDVDESGVFSIICDECADIPNQEQLSLSVRYVVREKVCESFIGFFELDDRVSGEATVPLDLNFTHARAQKATARNIHGNAPE